MSEKPPKLSIEGKRFNLVLNPSFMENEMVELQQHYGLTSNTAVARFALEELHRRKDEPQNTFKDIGLSGFVADYRFHDFSDYLKSAKWVVISASNFAQFWHQGRNAALIEERFLYPNKSTHIFLNRPRTKIESTLVTSVVKVAEKDFSGLDRSRLVAMWENGYERYLPQFTLMTEDVAITTPFPYHENHGELALIWQRINGNSYTQWNHLYDHFYAAPRDHARFLVGYAHRM